MDDRLRALERDAEAGSDADRLRYFLALHRGGRRVPLKVSRKELGQRFAPSVNMTLEVVSHPAARVPVEIIILMNIGDKRQPLEAFPRWTGKFTFRFTEDSDEGPARQKLAAISPNGSKIEGCRIFNVWAGELVYVTWHKNEDCLPNDVPWLFDVVPVFDPARVRA